MLHELADAPCGQERRVDDTSPEGARLREDLEDWLARHGLASVQPAPHL
jgi:hypothetical protein